LTQEIDMGQVFRSHGAVSSHGGQGRALLKQRFRPALLSCIADKRNTTGLFWLN
jgi:hypothetical protein